MKKFVMLLFGLLSVSYSHSQLVVDTVPNPESMLQDFFGPSVLEITNLATKGATDYWGIFDGSNTNIGIGHGVIMANGDIDLALGPNDILEVGIFDDTGLEGDADFDILTGLVTLEADIISGRITEVIESWKNDRGAYMFIQAKKS